MKGSNGVMVLFPGDDVVVANDEEGADCYHAKIVRFFEEASKGKRIMVELHWFYTVRIRGRGVMLCD